MHLHDLLACFAHFQCISFGKRSFGPVSTMVGIVLLASSHHCVLFWTQVPVHFLVLYGPHNQLQGLQDLSPTFEDQPPHGPAAASGEKLVAFSPAWVG